MFGMWQAIKKLEKYKAGSGDGAEYNEGRHLRSLHPLSSLSDLTVPLLQNIEKQLKSDLQIVREVLSDCVFLYFVCFNKTRNSATAEKQRVSYTHVRWTILWQTDGQNYYS